MYFFKKKSEIHSLDEIKNIALKVLDNDTNKLKERILGLYKIVIDN